MLTSEEGHSACTVRRRRCGFGLTSGVVGNLP